MYFTYQPVSLPFCPPPSSFPFTPSPSTPTLPPFRKGQVSHGFAQSMAHQIAA